MSKITPSMTKSWQQLSSPWSYGDIIFCERVDIFTDYKSQVHLHVEGINMRQRRWLEFMADYDIDLQYHPGRRNLAPDSLSKRPTIMFLTYQKLDLDVVLPGTTRYMYLQIRSLLVKITAAQSGDEKLQKMRTRAEAWLRTDIIIHEKGFLYCSEALCAEGSYPARANGRCSQFSLFHTFWRGQDVSWSPSALLVEWNKTRDCEVCQSFGLSADQGRILVVWDVYHNL